MMTAMFCSQVPRKRRYLTKVAAAEVGLRLMAEGNANIGIYRCKACGAFHVTTHPRAS